MLWLAGLVIWQRIDRSISREALEAIGEDEDAAAAVGDRPLVARAVARAALTAGGRPLHGLAATGGPVPQRVRALLAPPPAFRRRFVVVPAALMIACCASIVLSAQDMDHYVDMAGTAHVSASAQRHPER